MGYTKPQTEIAFIPLKPGVDVSSSEDRRVLLDALAIMKRQEGCKGVWFGVPSEKSGEVEVEVEVEVVIDWADVSNGPTFISTPDFGMMLEGLSGIMLGGPRVIHSESILSFAPLEACVTQRVSAYFDAGCDEEGYLERKWGPVGGDTEIGIQGLSGSWAQKLYPHVCLGEGVEGKVFSAFVGWESLEKFRAFRGGIVGEQRGADGWVTRFEKFE